MLQQMGEQPAILSRGYARARPADGVVVVSDGNRIRADLDRSGDEPLMLARALPGVGVFVSADRHLAGLVAERRFGATVHLLDDGFQHLPLERSVDLLLVTWQDLQGRRTLPFGRLRELPIAARAAHGLVFTDDPVERHQAVLEQAGLDSLALFRLDRSIGAARAVEGASEIPPGAGRALLVAGIARPERFRADVERSGWTLAGELVFGDHQRFSADDVRRIVAAARACRADLVLTTEKDVVRLRRFRPFPVPLAWVPLRVAIEPGERFRGWLADRLAEARATGSRGRVP
jgi:tetraacyldisaccharide 4'-kinase